MATMQIKLKPFETPNFARMDLPPRPKQDGLQELPAVPVAAIGADALEDMAYEWLLALYKKAGKRCPFYQPAKAMEQSA